MNLDRAPVNWFDFAVVIIVLLGISKGRKNGMSVELLGTLQWICIVACGALFYKIGGDVLRQTTPALSPQFAYVISYITIAIVVKIVFSMIHKGVGPKLAGTNLFGRGEYYLGMLGGATRFLCVLIAALALMNAPYYSQAELAKWKAYQIDMYGSTYFDGFGTAQQQIFKESLLGSALKQNAEFLLVVATKPDPNQKPHKH